MDGQTVYEDRAEVRAARNRAEYGEARLDGWGRSDEPTAPVEGRGTLLVKPPLDGLDAYTIATTERSRWRR